MKRAAAISSLETKALLRAELARRRSLAGSDEHRNASEAICRAVMQDNAWVEAKLVCAFLPLPSEPRITPLWQSENGRAFCFPQIRNGDVVLIRIDDRRLLARANWRLEGAEFDLPTIDLTAVDLLLVPGLAFTADGRRLGRGGGYYDRLLARCTPRTHTLGVCFQSQLLGDLPTEPHDRLVQRVITESGVV